MHHRRSRSRARRALAQATLAPLVALLVACGPSGDGHAPTPTPDASPSATPEPTPTPQVLVRSIAPMLLGPRGRATSVSPRQWIVVQPGASPDQRTVVLPRDAGPGAGPLPVPGCALGADPATCRRGGWIEAVGESDWTAGQALVDLPSFEVPFPAAFGPGGEVALLTSCCGSNGLVTDVVPVPGARFIGAATGSAAPAEIGRGLLWRAPGAEYETLPAEGFADGPYPTSADATLTIVGGGRDPVRPVAWLPSGDAYQLVVLPLLDGDPTGGATSVDGGRIVGWSGDLGRVRPVLWQREAEGFSVRALPLPEGSAACGPAVAISGERIVGACDVAGGADETAVVWQRSTDGTAWPIAAVLEPAGDDRVSGASGLSGDLAVGWTGTDAARRPVAWRLP